MKKVLINLDIFNKLASAINTKLSPRKYQIKELPKAVDTVFTKKLEAVRKEYREFLYGPKSIFSDPYGMISAITDYAFCYRNDLQEIVLSQTGGIGAYAFNNCRNLRKISFPNCIGIGEYAFAHCVLLEEISGFPSGGGRLYGIFYNCINLRSVSLDWTFIPSYTFYNCEKLETANLPYTSRIDVYAFASCTNLKNISLPMVTYFTNRVFEDCSSIEELSLPNLTYTTDIAGYPHGGNFHNCINLKSIYAPIWSIAMQYEFSNCIKLENVYMPMLQYIPRYMFNSCKALVSIPSTSFPLVSFIDDFAFANCTSLEYAEFQNGFCLGYRANGDRGREFFNCISLKNIKLLGNLSQSQETVGVSPETFYNCYNLETIEYPHAANVCELAFYNCSKLSVISFPECNEIYYNAFENCISLEIVNIDSVKIIGQYAFNNCIKLSQVIFSQCSIIGTGAFKNCVELFEAELNAVTSISYFYLSSNTDQGIFYGCSKLRTIKLLNLVAPGYTNDYIAFNGCIHYNGMFKNCIRLENVFLSSSYSNIAPQMFYNCQALSSISIPECTIVGAWAFMNCSSLKSIDIPKCSHIYSQAFMNCISLSTINIASCKTLGSSAFQNCISLERIELFSAISTIPNGNNMIYSIYNNCFDNCTSISIISIAELSNIYLNIYSNAFRNCYNLETFITNAQGTFLGSDIFAFCSALSVISCPNLIIRAPNVFKNCTAVEEIHIGAFSSYNNSGYNYKYTFANCINLKNLFIMNGFIPYYDSNSMFYNCNFLQEGDLYVPSSLYNKYLYNTGNWLSVMDESRIHPI